MPPHRPRRSPGSLPGPALLELAWATTQAHRRGSLGRAMYVEACQALAAQSQPMRPPWKCALPNGTIEAQVDAGNPGFATLTYECRDSASLPLLAGCVVDVQIGRRDFNLGDLDGDGVAVAMYPADALDLAQLIRVTFSCDD